MASEYKPHYMGDLRSVVLATDNSPHSEGAIKEAIYVAKHCGAKLFVIQVLQVNPEFATEGLKLMEDMELCCRTHFDHIRDLAAEENVEIIAVCRRTDKPHEIILEEAEKRNADVIVMGRRGWKGLKKFLLGSVTAKVITSSSCKVLVVPKDAIVKSEVIMLATDGSKYSEAAEKEFLSMVQRCTYIEKFIVLSAAPSHDKIKLAEKNVQKVLKDAEERGMKIEPLVFIGEPHKVILQTAKDRNVDLIVLGTHGRKGLKKLALGSVSEEVITHSHCAVLIAKT